MPTGHIDKTGWKKKKTEKSNNWEWRVGEAEEGTNDTDYVIIIEKHWIHSHIFPYPTDSASTFSLILPSL